MDAEDAVLAAHQNWARALVSRDTQGLEALLHDDLVYVHATGLYHDRRAYMAYAAQGPRFLSVQLADARALVTPGMALLEGQLEISLQRAGQPAPQQLRSFAVQVWCHGPRGWQLRRAQTTAIQAPP